MENYKKDQKKLADKLVVNKKFDQAKNGTVEFQFSWTNKGGKVLDERMLFSVDKTNNLTEEFDINEYILHKEFCCIRRADKFTVREIDS